MPNLASAHWVLDADIRGFLDTLDHGWLVKFIEHRIADRRLLRLVQKWLAAGVMEDGRGRRARRGRRKGPACRPCWRISFCTTPSTSGSSTGDGGMRGGT
jgi:RNA-directed DNA polymerase